MFVSSRLPVVELVCEQPRGHPPGWTASARRRRHWWTSHRTATTTHSCCRRLPRRRARRRLLVRRGSPGSWWAVARPCWRACLRLCGRRDGAAGLQGVPLRSAPSCRGAGRSGERVGIHTYICIGVRRTVRTRQQLSLTHVHTGTPRRLDEMRRDCEHLALRRRRAPQEAS